MYAKLTPAMHVSHWMLLLAVADATWASPLLRSQGTTDEQYRALLVEL